MTFNFWSIVAFIVDALIVGGFAYYAVAWLYWQMGWKWGKNDNNPYRSIAKLNAHIYSKKG